MTKLPILFLIFVISCDNSKPSESNSPELEYPSELQKVFAKHGTLDLWKKMKAMSFEIIEDNGNEKHQIHLSDRRERIEGTTFITGYDGKDIWLDADSTYDGNPTFYHNLMFYFYAMPFVVADDGINYLKTDSLYFEGKSYPGIKISYEADIGSSPDDEYFIHYDPQTYQMVWLGYTVTYFSKEKSKEVKWIRYNDWQVYNGLVLPKSMTWYKSENGELTEKKGKAEFEKVNISPVAFKDQVFERTPTAVVVN